MSNSQDLLRQARMRLETAGIETALLDARHLLAFALGMRLNELGWSAGIEVDAGRQAVFERLIERRAAREPLQRLLGSWEFWSLDLLMGEAGLIPRPDSECLIEAVLSHWPDRSQPLRVLDLGTGTGCLLLAVLSEYPEATGVGIDIAPEAVALAQANAARLGLDGRARFLQGDWGRGLGERFDLVLSNPPYIPSREIERLEPEVSRYEPRRALDGGAGGFDAYRQIALELPGLLAPSGLAVLELGAGQAEAVGQLLKAQGLGLLGLRDDLQGVPRALLVGIRL